jgi:hypothetical protein
MESDEALSGGASDNGVRGVRCKETADEGDEGDPSTGDAWRA